jgi:uncharacterized membrane protein
MSKTKILCVSAILMALYVGVMYLTQSFAFGAYQIRIATCLYSLNYFFPFLILPLGLANLLSNMLLGGLGLPDIIGGIIVGVITGGGVYLIKRFKLPALLVVPVITFGPGLIVPVWLSYILDIPYFALAVSLCIGQILPALAGYLLIKILGKINIENLVKGKNLK